MNILNTPLPTELDRSQLEEMEHDKLVERYIGLQSSFRSLHNTITLYRRQMALMQDQTMRSSLIADISRKVNVADIDIMAEVAVNDIPRFFEAAGGALFIYDEETRLLVFKKSTLQSSRIPAYDIDEDQDVSLVYLLKNYKDPIAIKNLEHFEELTGQVFRREPCDDLLDNGAIMCPLTIGMGNSNRMLTGVLIICQREEGFHQYDTELATMIGEMMATALSTSSLIEKMSLLAETDGLTQLYNHRHFQQELGRAISMQKRYERDLSLIILDIDHFKNVNDTYGHQAGDHVLREISRGIVANVREEVDMVARYGGEEFAVILPETDIKGALVVAERIRSSIERKKISIGHEKIKVTLSGGIAQFTEGNNKNELIELADRALYKAKAKGRNCIVTSDTTQE